MWISACQMGGCVTKEIVEYKFKTIVPELWLRTVRGVWDDPGKRGRLWRGREGRILKLWKMLRKRPGFTTPEAFWTRIPSCPKRPGILLGEGEGMLGWDPRLSFLTHRLSFLTPRSPQKYSDVLRTRLFPKCHCPFLWFLKFFSCVWGDWDTQGP